MSQVYSFPISITAENSATLAAKLNDTIDALDTGFSGTSAPTVKDWRIWNDTNTPPARKIREPSTASWVTMFPDLRLAYGGLAAAAAGAFITAAPTSAVAATTSTHLVRKAEVDATPRTVEIHVGTLTAADEKFLLTGLPALTVIDAYIVSETGIASDAVNFWTFQVRNLTAAADLRSAPKSTNGAAITADTQYAIGLNQNLSVAAGAVLELQVGKGGAPSNLQELLVAIRFTVAV